MGTACKTPLPGRSSQYSRPPKGAADKSDEREQLTKDNQPGAIQETVQVPPGLCKGRGVPPGIPLHPSKALQVAAIGLAHAVVAGPWEHPQLIIEDC